MLVILYRVLSKFQDRLVIVIANLFVFIQLPQEIWESLFQQFPKGIFVISSIVVLSGTVLKGFFKVVEYIIKTHNDIRETAAADLSDVIQAKDQINRELIAEIQRLQKRIDKLNDSV